MSALEETKVSGAPRAYVKESLYRQGMCDLLYTLGPRVSAVPSTLLDPKNLLSPKSESLNSRSYVLPLCRLLTSIF